MAIKEVYNSGRLWVARNDVDQASLKIMILDRAAGYVPDVTADATVADIVAAELATTNYARKTVTGVTVSVNQVDDRVEVTADDLTWSQLGTITGPTIDAFVLYADEGSDAVSPLISVLYDVDELLSGGDTFLQLDASGLLRIL